MSLSPDGRHWWDGAEWRLVSEDGRWWWDGGSWRQIPISQSLLPIVVPKAPELPKVSEVPAVPAYPFKGGRIVVQSDQLVVLRDAHSSLFGKTEAQEQRFPLADVWLDRRGSDLAVMSDFELLTEVKGISDQTEELIEVANADKPRLTARPTSSLMLKRGEECYAEVPAELIGRHTSSRIVGGSRGFSLPVGHTRARVRIGGFSAHRVSETHTAVDDHGSLLVTSQRVVFVGARTNDSVPLGKLLDVDVYSDGVGIHKDGRAVIHVYRIAMPHLFRAYVEAAVAGL